VRFQSTPPPCGGKVFTLPHVVSTHTQLSRSILSGQYTFVESGRPWLLPHGGPAGPMEAQGGPGRLRGTRESQGGPGRPRAGRPRDAQGMSGRPREAQGGPGRLREAQGGTRRPREAQGGPGREVQRDPGRPKECQDGPGKPREAQGSPGRHRAAHQKEHKNDRRRRSTFGRRRTADNRREPLQTLIIPRVWKVYQIHHAFGEAPRV